MTYPNLLVHQLAVVTPVPIGDPTLATSLDDDGQVQPGTPIVTLVRGMVQPRTAREVAQALEAGAEVADYTIFLKPMRLSASAYITDANGSGPLSGGRRFQIQGIRSYEFGTVPHLEVDCLLVGSTEGPTVGS